MTLSLANATTNRASYELPPISHVQEMGGSSIAGGFVFRALHALNRLKPRTEKGSPPRAAFNAHYVFAAPRLRALSQLPFPP